MRIFGHSVFAALLLTFASAVLAAPPSASAGTPPGAPKVLVTIKPIHSLVSAVMKGAGTPELLIGGAASVHSYALRPSDARKIAAADLIFQVGPMLETYLRAPLANLTHGRVVSLADAPGLLRLAARHGGVWETADEDHHHHHGPVDPHLWLDPENAIAMTHAISQALCRADPVRAGLYRKNETGEVAALKRLEGEIASRLQPVRGRPYLVFHDAYHYFERRFGLKAAGAVAVAPDRPPGPQRLERLRREIVKGGAVCIFREPQFSPRIVSILREGTGIRTGVLDPLGADIPPGPGLYPRLMHTLTQSLADCLKR